MTTAVDRAAVRRALRASSAEHTLTEAADGATGLKAARESTFDCVLLDFRLPDADAFELLAALISPEGGRQAVIMLTGEVDQELALSLMRAGALDYLSKNDASPSNLARAIRYAKARRAFVGELQSAREDAEAKSRALDGLNRQKTLLLSIIAHDLRNPFQVLLGMSQTLKNAAKASDAASIERRANAIYEAATQANALIDGLFSWASLQMDSRSLQLAPVDPRSHLARLRFGVPGTRGRQGHRHRGAMRGALRPRPRRHGRRDPAQPRRQRAQIHCCPAATSSFSPNKAPTA